MPTPTDTSRAQLQHAADLLDQLLPQTTPRPWCDSDANRYAALVAPREPTETHRIPGHPELDWDEHEAYGGKLIAESIRTPDRRLLAVLGNASDHLPALLRAVAEEDPTTVGDAARTLAQAVLDTYQPATQNNPSRPRPHLVPDLVPTSSRGTPRAPRDATSSRSPLSYGGDEVAEPSRDDLTSSQSTSSQRPDEQADR